MLKGHETSLIFCALLALACGGNAVDVGHSESQGWADAPAEGARATTPQVIYEGELSVIDFTIDDTMLYALIEHQGTFELVACPLGRCRSERTTLLSGPLAQGSWPSPPLVLSQGSLYWLGATGEDAESALVVSCSMTGCSEAQLLSTKGDRTLVGTPEGAYWIDTEKALMRMAPNAEAPELVRSLADELIEPQRLSAQGDYLYFSDVPGESIRRVRKDGTRPTELVVEDDAIGGLSASSDAIYYPSQLLAGRIVQCPGGDCTAGGAILANNQRWPAEVQVQESEAFWLVNTSFSDSGHRSAVSSCSLPDCTSVRDRVSSLVRRAPNFSIRVPGTTFAVNRESVLWVEPFEMSGGNSLQRVSR